MNWLIDDIHRNLPKSKILDALLETIRCETCGEYKRAVGHGIRRMLFVCPNCRHQNQGDSPAPTETATPERD